MLRCRSPGACGTGPTVLGRVPGAVRFRRPASRSHSLPRLGAQVMHLASWTLQLLFSGAR
eukprot:411773-Alexandrium_andersonii.AAC.1